LRDAKQRHRSTRGYKPSPRWGDVKIDAGRKQPGQKIQPHSKKRPTKCHVANGAICRAVFLCFYFGLV
jgi:hypothetical protein